MERFLKFLSRIWIRLLAFNVLLIFLPAIGILSFRTYENTLLRQQERSMVQQGRILAAALGDRNGVAADGATRILVNMERRFDARLRVVDPELRVLADSSQLGPRSGEEGAEETEPEEPAVRESWTYRLGSFLYRLYARFFDAPPETPESDLDRSAAAVREAVIRDALDGRYGRGTAVSPTTRALTLYSAIPIRSDGRVVGAVLVSKSTAQILRALDRLRINTFEVVLASVVAAVVLSLLVATTIVRPLRRLRRESQAILDRRGRLTGRFKGSRRRDEIGDLTRALTELTRRLESHLHFIESFASDVSHEFKNPLASIRNATELLAEVEDPEERERFIGMVLKDIARLEHLLTGVREISRIDAQLDGEEVEPVPLDAVLRALVERSELHPEDDLRYRLELPEGRTRVAAEPARLAQVFENLLDNAAGFSPPGEEVAVELERRDGFAVVRISDRGPGIPEEHRERIFDRFFSYRPKADDGKAGDGKNGDGKNGDDGHTGLGLAIVRAIVEGYGGTVEARNRDGGGSVFEVRLPLVE